MRLLAALMRLPAALMRMEQRLNGAATFRAATRRERSFGEFGRVIVLIEEVPALRQVRSRLLAALMRSRL